jgi:hypothetical protein
MTDWRIYGHVMATLRSSYGFHMVLHARRMMFRGFHGRDIPYVLVLCPDACLGETLEAHLRTYDHVHIAGVNEPRSRPQSPIFKRDWEMIVTEARIPRVSNYCRRLWTWRLLLKRGDDAEDIQPPS